MTLKDIVASVSDTVGKYDVLSRADILYRELGGRYYGGKITESKRELLLMSSKDWHNTYLLRPKENE